MLQRYPVCRLFTAVVVVATATACGDVIRNGSSPVVLVVDSLTAASGGGFGAGTFSGTLHSDVLVLVTTPDPCTTAAPCPTIYSDSAKVVMHLVPKNSVVDPAANPSSPSPNNQVTISRYHVAYRRADGRNTPGVDVPFGFDGAVTGTAPPVGSMTLTFDLVRHVAKEESPLVQLVVSPNIISTIADVTLYGTDLVGNAVTAAGSISIDFGNFGDQ